jgi:hypothetical protein
MRSRSWRWRRGGWLGRITVRQADRCSFCSSLVRRVDVEGPPGKDDATASPASRFRFVLGRPSNTCDYRQAGR